MNYSIHDFNNKAKIKLDIVFVTLDVSFGSFKVTQGQDRKQRKTFSLKYIKLLLYFVA